MCLNFRHEVPYLAFPEGCTQVTMRKTAVVANSPLNTFFCFENRQAHCLKRSNCLPVSSHRHEDFCLALVISDPLSCQAQMPSYMRTQNPLNQRGGTIVQSLEGLNWDWHLSFKSHHPPKALGCGLFRLLLAIAPLGGLGKRVQIISSRA